ncbi:hypothetical protein PIROE2DRAFT_15213, partial [Piromyces sp. E2]
TEISELLKGDYIVNEKLTYNSCKNLVSHRNTDVEKELLVDFIKNFNIYKVEGESKLEKFTNLFIKLENAGLSIPFRFNNYSTSTDYNKYSTLLIYDHSLNSDYLQYPELDSLFKEYIKKVLSVIYDNEQEIEEKAKIIYEIEKKIQSLQLNELSKIANEKYQREEVTLNVLKQRYPFIDWELYLKKRIEFYGMECDDFIEVIFYDINEDVREAINSFYNDIDFNDLATYMEWYNLLKLKEISEDIRNTSNEIDEELAKYKGNSGDNFGNDFNFPYDYNNNFNEFPTDGYLNNEGDFLNDDFLNGEFPGGFNMDMDEIMKLMDVECITVVSMNMPYAIGKYYSDRKLSENVTNEIKQMIKYIKESMLERIPKLEWLDEETKQKAIEKVLKMKEIIGYQEKYDDPKMIYKLYEYIDHSNPLASYLTNVLEINSQALLSLSKSSFEPMEVNAYYSGILNSIYSPTSLLKSQFYDSNQPDYLKLWFYGITYWT